MSGPPTLIMFIRHGEKPRSDGSPPLGITPEGTADSHSLLVRGWVRAGALIGYFGSAHDPVEVPSVIFAASAGDASEPHGKRASQTVTPLSLAHGIQLEVGFGVGDEARLGVEILRQDGPVLVCWEHHNIPLIVAAIGAEAAAASRWPDERFDLVWLFRRSDAGQYSFCESRQALLEGDVTT